jgi:hypothetical protein
MTCIAEYFMSFLTDGSAINDIFDSGIAGIDEPYYLGKK